MLLYTFAKNVLVALSKKKTILLMVLYEMIILCPPCIMNSCFIQGDSYRTKHITCSYISWTDEQHFITVTFIGHTFRVEQIDITSRAGNIDNEGQPGITGWRNQPPSVTELKDPWLHWEWNSHEFKSSWNAISDGTVHVPQLSIWVTLFFCVRVVDAQPAFLSDFDEILHEHRGHPDVGHWGGLGSGRSLQAPPPISGSIKELCCEFLQCLQDMG